MFSNQKRIDVVSMRLKLRKAYDNSESEDFIIPKDNSIIGIIYALQMQLFLYSTKRHNPAWGVCWCSRLFYFIL